MLSMRLLWLLTVFLLVGIPLLAQVDDKPVEKPPVARCTTAPAENGIEVGVLSIGQTVVLRLYYPAGGFTPAQRVEVIAGRLNAVIALGFNWQIITMGKLNDDVVLQMSSDTLVTVDIAHAKRNNSTPEVLARQWQKNIQTALWRLSYPRQGTDDEDAIRCSVFEHIRSLQAGDLVSLKKTIYPHSSLYAQADHLWLGAISFCFTTLSLLEEMNIEKIEGEKAQATCNFTTPRYLVKEGEEPAKMQYLYRLCKFEGKWLIEFTGGIPLATPGDAQNTEQEDTTTDTMIDDR